MPRGTTKNEAVGDVYPIALAAEWRVSITDKHVTDGQVRVHVGDVGVRASGRRRPPGERRPARRLKFDCAAGWTWQST